jgi:hypothetical protein
VAFMSPAFSALNCSGIFSKISAKVAIRISLIIKLNIDYG